MGEVNKLPAVTYETWNYFTMINILVVNWTADVSFINILIVNFIHKYLDIKATETYHAYKFW